MPYTQIKTTLEEHGLIWAAASISHNPDFDPMTEPGEPAYNLDGFEIFKMENGKRIVITSHLNRWEREQIEDTLIEKFVEDRAETHDYLIDEAIQRGREYARNAYA